jgi:hypothetical protein
MYLQNLINYHKTKSPDGQKPSGRKYRGTTRITEKTVSHYALTRRTAGLTAVFSHATRE